MPGLADEVEYRRATEADLEVGSSIFNRAQNDLYRRRGFDRTDRPSEVFTAPQRHVMAHDAERCFAAELGGQVVAYSAAIVRDRTWYFSALFVDPDFQGRGIGRQLFELSAAGAPPRRITIADAIQPISNGLYASRGLIPSTPVLVLGGSPAIGAPSDLEPGPPTASALHALDMAAYGFDRGVDHAFWTTQAEPTVWRRGDEAISYAYVSADGWLGPLAGRDEASAAAAFRAELSRRSRVTVEIPGSAAELVEVAFEAGLRIVNPPGLLLHSRPATLPTALIISGYWLM